MAKEPVPGRVKTRLTARYTAHEAALLAEAALADTLAAGLRVPARRRVLVLDGAPGPWLPPGYDVVPQVAGGLDARLAAAFAACDGPALLVGMDTPHLRPAVLARAFAPDAWRHTDAYFGPADDGGFWALGLARPRLAAHLLLGVPMSTSHTGAAQRARLTAARLRVTDLPALRDIDTPSDAVHVAVLAPTTRFARTLSRLRNDAEPEAADGAAHVAAEGRRSGRPHEGDFAAADVPRQLRAACGPLERPPGPATLPGRQA